MPQISGLYPNQLSDAQYQLLLTVLQQEMLAGELSGGKLFTGQTIQDLQTRSQDFTSLPQVTAYARALADSITRPLALLEARYGALRAESLRFAADMKKYLQLLGEDMDLIERELHQVTQVYWAHNLPPLPSAVQFAYSLETEHPLLASASLLTASDPYNLDPNNKEILFTDPSGSPLYPDTGRWLLSNGLWGGMAGHVLSRTTTGNVALKWTVLHPAATPQTLEILTGDNFDWTTCDFLLTKPVLNLLSPTTKVLSPAHQESAAILLVRGTSTTGTLPIYVRLTFYQRTQTVSLQPTATANTFSLSANNLSPEGIVVFSDTQAYQEGLDYSLSLGLNNNGITFGGTTYNQTITVLFTEYTPAYQCSIDNHTWSPLILFDTENPLPDPVGQYVPLRVKDGWFPLIDETGRNLGVEIRLNGLLQQEYLLETSCAADGNYEALAELEVDLDTPGYFDAVHLDPQSEFPMTLKKITYEGFQTGNPITVWAGNQGIDRPVTVRFTDPARPVFCRKLTLTFGQESYSLETVSVQTTSALRQNALATLQTSIPFSSRTIPTAQPKQTTGYQYSFGLKNLAVEATKYYTASNTVLPCGPFTVNGVPKTILFQANGSDLTSVSGKGHLYYQLYDAQGTAYPVSGITMMAQGQTTLFSSICPTLPTGFVGSISKVDFYCKLVLFGPTVLSQFSFQVGF